MSGRVLTLALLSLFLCSFASAGGPRLVGGPAVGTRAAFGIDGQPFISGFLNRGSFKIFLLEIGIAYRFCLLK